MGNPEEKYHKSRHNIGFVMVDFIAKNCGAGNFSFEKKLNSEIAKCPDFVLVKAGLQNRGSSISASRNRDRKPVMLAKPRTFVNKIGEAVKKLRMFYKIKPEEILIIQDDLDIKFGEIKLSFNKDSAGHRGVDSIIGALKSKKFYRLRVGLGSDLLKRARSQKTLELKKKKVGDFVLSPFTLAEQKKLPQILKKALEAIITFHG